MAAVADCNFAVQVVVTVLFGTEYGFAQEISGKLCEMLQELGKYW